MASELRLRVAASTIPGKGIARLDSDSFGRLRLVDGMAVLVSYGAKTIELAAKQDSIFTESTVRLMEPDIEALRATPGMEVIVTRRVNSESINLPVKDRKTGRRAKANTASLDRF